MQIVNSVLGPLDVAAMGVTLMHEHVCMGSDGLLLDSRLVIDHADRLGRAVARLQAARLAGITTIVDATPIDLNRDAADGASHRTSRHLFLERWVTLTDIHGAK
jgi:phosphotriesterase-related protein